MLYLLPNTADQDIYTTAKEGGLYLDAFTNYLFHLEEFGGHLNYYFIGTVDEENDRYTKFIVSTDSDDGANSSILIPSTVSGKFKYTIYGQNSDSNLDPENAAVVGEVEQGTLKVISSATYYNEQGGTAPTIQSYGG